MEIIEMKEQKTYNHNEVWFEDDGGRILCNGPYKDKDGVFYYKDGKYHREDGPAREWTDGTKEWFLNDQLHREDGPAVIYTNGTKEWFLNNECVYSNIINDLCGYDLSDAFKLSIIKYELSK
jgi:hypothetical protein